jgi:8-oxo-dGTP diphosphatase
MDLEVTKTFVSVALLDGAGRLLLVRESKPENRDKWNLPGGHLEFGETLTAGATREAREETNLAVTLDGLLGVYTHLRDGAHGVRFVFVSRRFQGSPSPADGITELRWTTPDEIDAMADAHMVHPRAMRHFARDVRLGVVHPLSVLNEHVER